MLNPASFQAVDIDGSNVVMQPPTVSGDGNVTATATEITLNCLVDFFFRVAVKDQTVVIKVDDSARIEFTKSAISSVVNKTAEKPAPKKNEAKKGEAGAIEDKKGEAGVIESKAEEAPVAENSEEKKDGEDK